MRAAMMLIPALVLFCAIPARADDASTSPSVDAMRQKARWAELRAQRRILFGDYEGAVRDQAQADSDRRAAYRLEQFDRLASEGRR